MAPLIALVGRRVSPGSVASWRGDAVAVPGAYLRALRRAGAREAILPPVPAKDEEAGGLLSRFDGLLLVGGGDIDPCLYGREPHPQCYGIDRDTDLLEMALVRAAVQQELPLLAVCRGMQVLNVALGGTLDQHVTGRAGLMAHGIPGVLPEPHVVRVEPDTRTARAAGEGMVGSSSHHQVVERLGRGLAPVAWTADGLVEGVEHERGWAVGVQWHPEVTASEDPANQGLFDELVRQARS